MESMESQKQAFHPSHSSLEISPKPRDSHLSTAPTTRPYLGETKTNRKKNCGPWKSGNPKPGFPLFHSPDSLRRKENSIQEKSVNPNAVYTKLLTPPLTPRHGSFIAAILCSEAGVKCHLKGMAVWLDFPN